MLCPFPLNPWICASLVDDQVWARPPKPPTFGEFLSQHKAEVSSRRRRKNSRPQAKVAPRAYRWGAPPWDMPLLSMLGGVESSLAVLAWYLLSLLPSLQCARCSLRRSPSQPSPTPYPFALSTPVTMIIAGREKRKLCPQRLSLLSPYPWRRRPQR